MGHITRVELIIFRDGSCWLLRDHRGAWHLPAAVCAPAAHTGQLALALLRSLGLARPGQRLWLLGLWPPEAVYLALLPDAADLSPSASAGDWWPPAEAAALVAAEEAARIHRAAAWLADGGASRRGIA